MIVQDASCGALLPESELDARMAQGLAGPRLADGVHLLVPRLDVPAVGVRRVEMGGPLLLGEPLPGTPQSVHDEMVLMASRGDIPVTKPEHRNRCMTSTALTAVPEGPLRIAWRHGYIGPNLPAPRALEWRNRGAGWYLAPSGRLTYWEVYAS